MYSHAHHNTCCLPPQRELTICRVSAATLSPQMPPVLRSCVAFIATSLLALTPTAAAQLCSLESCLLDKVAKVCVCVPGVPWDVATPQQLAAHVAVHPQSHIQNCFGSVN